MLTDYHPKFEVVELYPGVEHTSVYNTKDAAIPYYQHCVKHVKLGKLTAVVLRFGGKIVSSYKKGDP